jgi:hypothetical protein
MNPSPIGTRIQVVSNTNGHNYRIRNIYRVHQVDSDGTFKAIDDLGIEGDFLKWKDCQSVGIGWEWIREHLDARSLDLLSAFDGLEQLRLRDEVETKVITSIPNLADAILEILPAIEEEREILSRTHPNDDDDEFGNLLSAAD